MDWQNVGGSLIRAGAPIIGNALGGPLGGMIGNALGGVLANALGTEETPEAVDEAIKAMPPGQLQEKLSAAEAEAQARWPALAEIAKAESDAAERTLIETSATMRVEAASGDTLQRWWRPIYASELVVECAMVWIVGIGDLMFGSGKIATFLIGASNLLSVYWAARFGVLGVYVGGRSYEKATAIAASPAPAGEISPSMVNQIIKAVRKK